MESPSLSARHVALPAAASPVTQVSTNCNNNAFSYPGASSGLSNGSALVSTDTNFLYKRKVLSLTDDPKIVGRPTDFDIPVREVRLSAGAGFLVPLTGDMMTMPVLPKIPAARNVKPLPTGQFHGLIHSDLRSREGLEPEGRNDGSTCVCGP